MDQLLYNRRLCMRIIEVNSYEDLSRKAAAIIAAQVIGKPDSVLGLATGSTPIGTYRYLTEWYKKGDLDFEKVRSVNLDEYAGLGGDNDQSYRYFMNHNLFNHINIHMENTNVPNGRAEDLQAEGSRYDALIAALGGIDLQLLGIGHFSNSLHEVFLNYKVMVGTDGKHTCEK